VTVPRKRVLFVAHNHPKLLVGGVEMYVADVYRALETSDDFEPLLLARAGRPYTPYDALHADSPLSLVGPDPNQYLLFTDFDDFDYFQGTFRTSKEVLTRAYRDFLLNAQPDVVHFQHTVFLGYDIVRVTRNTLPDVPIVYSLHEYIPICHRDGVMVRTRNGELCEEESPRRCHECFPEVTPQQFYMRKRFIQSHLGLVDTFIAPSAYVKQRYVQWGLDPAKIVVEPQGFVAESAPPADEPARPARDRFAYFGQLNPYKGADVLLRAMDILGPDADAHLTLFGANLDKQSPRWQEEFGELLDVGRPNVSFVGGYDRSELGKLMAEVDWVVVPSVWWETGPLVVWEAFQYGRPVICSDIGGMSEKVADGVNGLHFRRGDAVDLAAAMQRAMETPGLWDTLRGGIPSRPGHPLDEHVANLTGIYSSLLADRRAVDADAPLQEVAGG
jgi:glycosyltransferase involved in cell wall biosynthesis